MSSPQGRTLDESFPNIQHQYRLTPLRDYSVVTEPARGQTGRKRKLVEFSSEAEIGTSFTIQAHPSSVPGTPLELLPIALLDRSCLPLAYIDTNRGTEDLGSRLFSARIAALETEPSEVQHSSRTIVLIARSHCNASMYAVERVQQGIYALCRLGVWVTHHDIQRLQKISENGAPRKEKSHAQASTSSNDWWRPAAIYASHKPRDCGGQKHKFARLDNFKLCSTTKAPGAEPANQEPPPNSLEEFVPPTSNDMVEEPTHETPQEPDEVLSMIKVQYQEALYVSKTSLAYFAKGPLSRARAAFRETTGSSTNAPCLTVSLRSNVLSLSVMDKKYREAIPNIVKELPISVLPEDEISAVVSLHGKKIRKSKKGKVGKDGLYPGEEASIAQWWLSTDKPSTITDSSDGKDEAIRALLLEQRARETQLQIILVLETLALEASTSSTITNQDVPLDNTHGQESAQPKKSKSKKPQDLNTLLDLLVDRLCIWQSMNIDEGKGAQATKALGSQQGGKMSDKVHLRDFCVDVVLPFYGARLPDVSKMLCQKLGGPKTLSPARPPLAKAASASQTLVRPGAAVQRQPSRKPRGTLERVLTDEMSRSRKPSLSRSATESMVPTLKREINNISLSAVPLSRLNLQKSKRYSQREVDLNVVSQAAEARLKKKANVEQELQGAIAALKRPNPRMAVKEFVEGAEKRAAESHTRKPKNPIRNLFARGVQVTATPSRNRRRDVRSRLPPVPKEVLSPEEIPPSSGLRAPDSIIKALPPAVLTSNECPKTIKLNVLPSVGQTPTRGSSKMTNPLRMSAHALTSIDQTPTRGPSKLTNPLLGSATKGTNDSHNLVPPTRIPGGLPSPRQFLSTSQLSQLGPSWPLEVHETPSKRSSLLTQGYFPSRYGPSKTPIKPSRAEKPSPKIIGSEHQETPPKPIESAKDSRKDPVRAVVPAAGTNVYTPTDEMGPSIYQSLGWDDVDELS